jgi:hypothetical protein
MRPVRILGRSDTMCLRNARKMQAVVGSKPPRRQESDGCRKQASALIDHSERHGDVTYRQTRSEILGGERFPNRVVARPRERTGPSSTRGSGACGTARAEPRNYLLQTGWGQVAIKSSGRKTNLFRRLRNLLLTKTVSTLSQVPPGRNLRANRG